MRIEHIGLWVKDLESMKSFYDTYFHAKSSELYHNKKTGFRSYFLTFSSGSRLEIMNKEGLNGQADSLFGYAHIAIVVGGKEAVDEKVKQLIDAGFPLLNGPRTTGDGYYEAVIQDVEGNLIEIRAE